MKVRIYKRGPKWWLDYRVNGARMRLPGGDTRETAEVVREAIVKAVGALPRQVVVKAVQGTVAAPPISHPHDADRMFWTARELARALGLSTAAIYKLLGEAVLDKRQHPALKSVRIPRASVEEFFRQWTSAPPPMA